jgi:hypothetical protein
MLWGKLPLIAMSTEQSMPTVADATTALKQLQSDLLELIANYENHYGVCINTIDVNHLIAIGYPRRTARVLLTAELMV